MVCPAGDLSRRLCYALSELGMAEVSPVSEYPRMGTIASLGVERKATICFLDTHSNTEHALLLVAELAALMPVVAVHPRNDADVILRALRRGAAEFLADPTAEQVRAILERLSTRRLPAEASKLGAVYGVIPGKPGSGGSTLAVQLACELRRRGAARVLLADLDAGCGSIAFQLKLKSDFNIGDAVRDAGRLDDDLWERLTVHAEGIDVALAPPDARRDMTITPPVATELVAFLRSRYDCVIFDLPGAAFAVASGCALLAQELLLVTSNELAVLHATRRAVEYLEHESVERGRLRLVVSRYVARTGLKREDVQAALGLSPAAVLNADPISVQNAILEGKPVARTTSYGRAVEQLASRLQNSAQPAGTKEHGGWFRLFGKRR